MDCTYCYENIAGGKDMTVAAAKEIIARLLYNTESDTVTILFHGGEPTLLSADWFKAVIEYGLSEADKQNKSIRFTIQTNLLNVSEEKLELFRHYKISMGVSIDNVRIGATNQRQRVNKVLDNIKNLRQRGMKVGVLSTINHSNFSFFSEIMTYLQEELGIMEFKANPVYNVGAGLAQPPMLPENFFRAYKDIIDHMIETKGKGLIEKNVAIEIIRFFSEDEQTEFRETLCHEHTCGAGRKVISITTEGNILPCGRFQWDESRFYLGNMDARDADVGAYEDAITQFHELVPENWFDCAQCPAKKICSFGCQAFINRSLAQANIECLPTKMKYNYLESQREQLFEAYLNLKDRLASKSFLYHDKQDEEEEETSTAAKQFSPILNMYQDSGDDSGSGYIDAVD
jgi:uncharacterized protein